MGFRAWGGDGVHHTDSESVVACNIPENHVHRIPHGIKEHVAVVAAEEGGLAGHQPRQGGRKLQPRHVAAVVDQKGRALQSLGKGIQGG